MPSHRNIATLKFCTRLFAAAGVALSVGACGTSDKAGDLAGLSGQNSDSLASRLMSKPDVNKRSMFDPNQDSGDQKTFDTKLFGGNKEFKQKEFRGSKLFKTGDYAEGAQRQPWAGLTARESAQETHPSLTGSYATGQSRDAGRGARESGASYRDTGTYKTSENIVGTKGLRNAAPPKIIPDMVPQGMSESDVRSLLNKD